ncbi:MAG: pyridoxal phosphate-dependent aminotransferase [Reyranella sp.]|uniref:pyridoxal phosphate-dependent aminotransferase n=1 Tax=Reyranella sp. TaxID=1929291 RepID=UPI001ACDC7E7|nr:pyridoxal phosphate-dependent aminotransferase [Reyranella sp.]MBN9090938.1 pyridoxal phosphate-dependent aminotransferase [Reyranella sp.]
MFEPAERLKNVKVSASAAMTRKVRELRAQGVKIVGLSSGEPDFKSPINAIEAANTAALAGETKYPPQDGIVPLKKAVQKKFKRDNNLDYALDEIMVSNGSKQIMFGATMASVNPGDEVIIPAPGWISYADQVKLCGGVPVSVSCPENNQFRLRAADLDAAITDKTKWVVLNFPNNPTGAVCTREEMKELAEVLLKHPKVLVMSDEIYEHLVYDDVKMHSIAEVEPKLKDRTLTVNGASKAYAMTGWRVGYAGGPKPMIQAMMNMQGQATAGVSTVGQAAVTAALEGPQDLIESHRADYQNRRNLVVGWLREAKGITCHKPEGAFYVFPNIAGCIGKTTKAGRKLETDTDFVTALLEERHVATVQGTAYGMSPYFRISYATDLESLREGCKRIQEFCADLR